MPSESTHVPPLKVSIVGAGIAGLSAAIALRRNGHHVQIFEASDVIEEVGAAIVVPLNAQCVLKTFGYSKENLNSVNFHGIESFDAVTGDRSSASWAISKETPSLLVHRSDLHTELYRLATGPGEGPPATIHLSSKVIECHPDQGLITLSDGPVISSDLILGADGIASFVRTSVLGHVVKSVPSGLSNYRGLISMDAFEGRTDVKWIRDGISGARMIVRRDGGGAFRMIFVYPCRGGALLNVVGIFKDPKQNEPGESRPLRRTHEARANVLETFSDFHPMFRPVLEVLDERVMKWQLRKVPTIPTWVRGHAALLGDAAHGTLPTMAQGSAMAIEDAGALGVLLPAGTRRSNVPARLAGYESLRRERGDFINQESLDQAIIPGKLGGFFRCEEMQGRILEFDAIQAAQEYFEQHFAVN
ncbi:FAD/NAD(P)-binding domain-containing protein [Mycena alexandri]|uniref:FAD/NAD(P)-binding domain-containing protein n=1 Tax=Mycena alexandri TaxID=1745969 RepID=A0AAD6WVY3_9AGAR|nr:FAD/NAD(P)-binding domain-containing protein [Mycena alexandri]